MAFLGSAYGARGFFGWVTLLQRSRSWARHMASLCLTRLRLQASSRHGMARLFCSYSHVLYSRFCSGLGYESVAWSTQFIHPARTPCWLPAVPTIPSGAGPGGASRTCLIVTCFNIVLSTCKGIDQVAATRSRFSFPLRLLLFLFARRSSQGPGQAGWEGVLLFTARRFQHVIFREGERSGLGVRPSGRGERLSSLIHVPSFFPST